MSNQLLASKVVIVEEEPCEIHSIAITENGPSRSPKTIDGDHRNRFIAIDGPANRGDPPELIRGSLQA